MTFELVSVELTSRPNESRPLRHGHDHAGRARWKPSCAAMRAAGFTQVMLNAARHRRPPRRRGGGDRRPCAQSGLRVTGFQVLRDFEGLSGHLHAYKVDVAQAMLEMCQRARLAAAARRARRRRRHATGDTDALVADLRKLAMLAVPLGIRVAYEALSWGRHVNEFPQAWDIVADAPTAPTSDWRSTRSTSSPATASLERAGRASTPARCSWCSCRTSCGRRSARARSASRPRATSACSRRRRAQRAARRARPRALDATGLPRRLQLRGLQRRLPQLPLAVGGRARTALGEMAHRPSLAPQPAAARREYITGVIALQPLRRADCRARPLSARGRAVPPGGGEGPSPLCRRAGGRGAAAAARKEGAGEGARPLPRRDPGQSGGRHASLPRHAPSPGRFDKAPGQVRGERRARPGSGAPQAARQGFGADDEQSELPQRRGRDHARRDGDRGRSRAARPENRGLRAARRHGGARRSTPASASSAPASTSRTSIRERSVTSGT